MTSFTSSDFAALLHYATTNTHGFTLDLDEPDHASPDGDIPRAHITREKVGFWSICPDGAGYLLDFMGFECGSEETQLWSRPVANVDTALAILDDYTSRTQAARRALAALLDDQAAEAIDAGGSYLS
jgi:hypothetical protein